MTKLRIYIADVSSTDTKTFLSLYSTLPKERREKIDGFTLTKDKYLSLFSGLLLERVKKDYKKENEEIVFNENGKPYFISGDIYFNLSHSGEKVCCAVSDSEIGCDIQKIGEYKEKTVNGFFSPTEREYVLSSDDKTDAFYSVWTLKESYIKNLGESIIKARNLSVITEKGVKVPEKTFYICDVKGYKLACCVSTEEEIETSFIYC